MKKTVELAILEQEIYEDHQTFKGIPAPRNSFTESRWRKVEELYLEVASEAGLTLKQYLDGKP